MNLTELEIFAEENEVKVVEMDFSETVKGLYGDGIIALNKLLPTATYKKCILAEELGHHFTNSGDITDLNELNNIKQERIARKWAIEHLIPIHLLIDAFEARVNSRFELAESLDVTEEFLEEALAFYKAKYGIYCRFNDYLINFEPFYIIKEIQYDKNR